MWENEGRNQCFVKDKLNEKEVRTTNYASGFLFVDINGITWNQKAQTWSSKLAILKTYITPKGLYKFKDFFNKMNQLIQLKGRK